MVLGRAQPANDDFDVARADLGGGLAVAVAVRSVGHEQGAAPDAAVALVDGEKIVSRADGWRAVLGHPPPLDRIAHCETWLVRAERVDLGPRAGARLGLLCRTGEDAIMTSEHATVLRVPDPPSREVAKLDRVWWGPGDRTASALGICVESETVTFHLAADGKALDKKTVVETEWNEPPKDTFSDDLVKQHRAQCKPHKSERTSREPLRTP